MGNTKGGHLGCKIGGCGQMTREVLRNRPETHLSVTWNVEVGGAESSACGEGTQLC